MFQNYVFKHKRDVTKVYSFGPFLGPIYPRNNENIAKNQKFLRNCTLRTIRWHKF